MKTFLLNIAFLFYSFSSLAILCIAMAFPFYAGMASAPVLWVAFIIYPLALIVAASQQQVFIFFFSKFFPENTHP